MAWDNTPPALVVDGLSVFHSVAGPSARLTNGYTYSFVIQLTSAIKKFKPKGVFVCWDHTSKMRTALLPTYKGTRESSMNDVKRKYLEDVKRFLTVAGVDQLEAPGHEADDVGAMLANTLEKAVLVSNDKDWLQLVRPEVGVFYRVPVGKGKTEKKLITHENFTEMTGYSNPEEFVMALCALGDSVDNIDGLYGVGPAAITSYFLNLKNNGNRNLVLEKFFADSELYLRNKALIDLRHIIKIDGLCMTPGKFDEDGLKELLEELTFASMLKNFPEWVKPYKEACADISTSS